MLSYFSVYLCDDVYVDIIHNSPVTPIIVEIGRLEILTIV